MPTALVTGGNRGIGHEVCRGLAQRGWRVLLGARDLAQGQAAAASLPGDVEALELDLTDPAAVQQLARRIEPLDLLVNNAATAFHGFDLEVVRRTLGTNVHGTLAVTDAMLPKIVRGGQIVMVSSGMGELSGVSEAVRRRFDPPRDRASVLAALREFEDAVARGAETREGWPRAAYQVSKVALNALTRLLARELRDRGIRVNAVCPGWVRTDMGGPSAPRSVEQGAASVLAAVTTDRTGTFFRDGRPIPW